MKMINSRALFISIGIIIFVYLFSCCPVSVEAQQIPVGQDVGAVERATEEIKREKKVTEELMKGKEEPDIEEKEDLIPEEPERPKVPGEKVLINKIEVNGVIALSPSSVRGIVAPYEGRELSMEDFKEISDLITDEYRAKGYVTSLAYLPPQQIQDNILRIDVAEGRVGNIKLSGSKYFKERLLLRYITLKKDDIFNYDVLRRDMSSLNVHPDRSARALLARGEERGETDVNIEVKDRLPIHVTLGYDNYNSRYLERNRYYVELQSTNLLGYDDIASAEVQLGEAGRYQLYSARYMLPVTRLWKVGAYYIHVDQSLGKEVGYLNIEGKGDIISTYISYKAIDEENLILSINSGFEYKNIENEMLGIVVGEDDIRIAKVGLDLDYTDRFNGRIILNQEFDLGIEDFMDGLEKKDPRASRLGAGGRFFRTVTNAARIQALPADMSLMLRGAMQLTAYNLVSSEQFHIGGMTTVRGYPRSEHAGDRGYTASAELYIPPYFMPKDAKVPFTKTTYYDAIRFLAFFDWGYVENRNPQVGESKDRRFTV